MFLQYTKYRDIDAVTWHDACHVTKSPRLPPLFFGAGQRSYMELLRGRRESLGTRLPAPAFLIPMIFRVVLYKVSSTCNQFQKIYVAEQLRESLYGRHEGAYCNLTGRGLSGVHQR